MFLIATSLINNEGKRFSKKAMSSIFETARGLEVRRTEVIFAPFSNAWIIKFLLPEIHAPSRRQSSSAWKPTGEGSRRANAAAVWLSPVAA